MKKILSKKTKTSPEISYDDLNGSIDIKGRTLMLDPEIFWALNISVIKNIASKRKIDLNLNFEYINTKSLRCLTNLIQISNLNINWICDEYDEDMIEIGEILKKTTNCKINFLIEH